MNEQELTRWRIVEEILNKRLSQKDAAVSLDLSERQLRNLLTPYNKERKQGLITKIGVRKAIINMEKHLKVKFYK